MGCMDLFNKTMDIISDKVVLISPSSFNRHMIIHGNDPMSTLQAYSVKKVNVCYEALSLFSCVL